MIQQMHKKLYLSCMPTYKMQYLGRKICLSSQSMKNLKDCGPNDNLVLTHLGTSLMTVLCYDINRAS